MPNREELLLLELAEARGQVERLNLEMLNRAAPVVANLIDALQGTTRSAREGNRGAKASLAHFFAALDAAREVATSPITIVRNGS